jgi:hypothetical protein
MQKGSGTSPKPSSRPGKAQSIENMLAHKLMNQQANFLNFLMTFA